MNASEWVGGIVALPSFVSDEGEPYRPSALVLVEPESGLIVGTTLARPDEVLERAPAMFLEVTGAPMVGAPRRPSRVRVAAPDLFDALRHRVGDVDVVLAPTPELDPAVSSLHAGLLELRDDDVDDESLTYLGPGIELDDVSRMFRAAARLYRLQPWRIFPQDGFASIRCERLAIADGALCVVGQMRESYGFVLFQTVADAVDHGAAIEAMEPGHKPALPRHIMFSYHDAAALGPVLAAEVSAHGWEVAGPAAHPSAIVVDVDLVTRGLTREELVGVTAIMEAIADFIEGEAELVSAWDEREPLEWRSEIDTVLGAIAVDLAAPLWLPDPAEAARARLLDRFAGSPEGAPELVGWAELILDHASSYCGVELTELTAPHVRELLFEVIPRKVSVGPEAAPEIVRALKALLGFAARELGSESARRSLKSLKPEAEQRLARELADPRNFGMAKSFVMAGAAAGHDMGSQAGIQAWMEACNREGTAWPALPRGAPPRGMSPGSGSPRSSPGRAKVRAKRKASRKARKASRRR
jgi:hypothetical protein